MGCGISSYTRDRVVNFDEVRDVLSTGDLVFFCGTSTFSYMIQMGTFSPWSHVGMVVRLNAEKEFKRESTAADGLYLWHSIGKALTCPDLVTGRKKTGPQLSPLLSTLEHYNGDIAIRFLNKNRRISTTTKRKMLHFFTTEAPKCYEQSTWELYASPYLKQERNTSSYFCSELVLETYYVMGLDRPHKERPSNSFTPDELTSRGYDMQFKWFTPEYLLKLY